MRYFRKIGSLGKFMWQVNHMFAHMLIGFLFAWFLREIWESLPRGYIFLSVAASVLPDLDHFIFAFTYGRHEWYAKEVRRLLKEGQIRTLTLFFKNNHKYNSGLATHNVYFIGGFFLLAFMSFQFDSKTGVVIFGAMVLHLLFDIVDDMLMLGYINDNWKHLKRKKPDEGEFKLAPEVTSTQPLRKR